MDKDLIEALERVGRGRLSFEHAQCRLTHQRCDGGWTPVFATAGEIRALMQLLLLRESEPVPRDVPPLDVAVRLLLEHLDHHPVQAVLGVEYLRRAALGDRLLAAAFGGPQPAILAERHPRCEGPDADFCAC